MTALRTKSTNAIPSTSGLTRPSLTKATLQVEHFADVVRPIYDAKKIDLADEGVDYPHIKVANHTRVCR